MQHLATEVQAKLLSADALVRKYGHERLISSIVRFETKDDVERKFDGAIRELHSLTNKVCCNCPQPYGHSIHCKTFFWKDFRKCQKHSKRRHLVGVCHGTTHKVCVCFPVLQCHLSNCAAPVFVQHMVACYISINSLLLVLVLFAAADVGPD